VESVRLYSPETDYPTPEIPFSIANGMVVFEIPTLRIYTIVVIE
jgi:hypothetical protein